jgi:hypothetical protein
MCVRVAAKESMATRVNRHAAPKIMLNIDESMRRWCVSPLRKDRIPECTFKVRHVTNANRDHIFALKNIL